MKRRSMLVGALAAAFGLASPLGAERYRIDLVHDPLTQWTGYADFAPGPAGQVSGELCIVRSESLDRPATPRTLLRIPISGQLEGGQLTLDIPQVESGPTIEGGRLRLARTEIEDSGEIAELQPLWVFGSWDGMYDEENSRPVPASHARLAELRRTVDPTRRVGDFLSLVDRDDQISIVIGSMEDGNFENRPLSIYDNFSREQAIAFEQRHQRAMLYTPGLVLAIVDPAKLAPLQAALDAMGDGARILNLELKDCGGGRMMVGISVPPLLEFWYARRLQTGGLAATAYPEGQGRDPGWTDPFTFRNPAIMAAFVNPRISFADKYNTLWNFVARRIGQFAGRRRPGFHAQGRVQRLGGGPVHIFRADIVGRALVVCEANRWEKLRIQATVIPADSFGAMSLSIQISEGFYARGASPPSDQRFRDNRIPDSDLERFQEVLVGAWQGNAAPGSYRCQQ